MFMKPSAMTLAQSTEAVTVLLATSQARLAERLGRLRPDWRLIELNGAPPADRLGGTVWSVVDWLLPELSGLEMCRRLREAENTRNCRITVVVEEGDIDARRRALQAGADDYIVGPVTAEALLVRIDRPHGPPITPMAEETRLRHGDILLDLAAHQVRVNGASVPLRMNEFRLLAHFLRNPDQVFSRKAIIACLEKDSQTIDERTVDVWIGRLRRSMVAAGVPDPIRTVRSIGYVHDSLD